MVKTVYQHTYSRKNHDLAESQKGKFRIIFHDGAFDPSEIVACALIRHVIPDYFDCPILRTSQQDIIEEAKADFTAILINIGGEICPMRRIYDCRTSEEMPHANIASVIWSAVEHGVPLLRQEFMAAFVSSIDSVLYNPYILDNYSVTSVLYRCNDFSVRNYDLFDDRFDFVVDTVEQALTGIIPGASAQEELSRRIISHPIFHIWNDNFRSYIRDSENRVELAAKQLGELVVLDNFECTLSKGIYSLPPEKLSCIYPTESGVWEIKQVPLTVNTDAVKKYFPTAWIGLTGQELSDAVGIPDCLFCSESGTTMQVKYKETAQQVALLGNLLVDEQPS